MKARTATLRTPQISPELAREELFRLANEKQLLDSFTHDLSWPLHHGSVQDVMAGQSCPIERVLTVPGLVHISHTNVAVWLPKECNGKTFR